MKLDSNKNLLNFLDKKKFKWTNAPNRFGPFYGCFENFPSKEEILNLTRRKKCLDLWDKSPGIFAYSDEFLIFSYSIINSLDEIGQVIVSYQKSDRENYEDSWELFNKYRYCFHFEQVISYKNLNGKFANFNATKARSIVKRFSKELSKG